MHTTKLSLHDYQKRAVDFVIDKKTAFLAMDMGLGKTVVTLKALEAIGKPAIVFAPVNPIYSVWPAEIEKWGINLTFDILHNEWKDQVFEDTNADILLVSYGGIKWLYNKLFNTKRNWKKRVLVLDESSMIKNHNTQRFKLLRKMLPLWDEYRICLSATPSPNGYHQLWPQYYMLDEGKSLYGSYSRFRGSYFHYSGPPAYSTTLRAGCYEEIKKCIAPLTFRLKNTDYIKMPEYIHNEIKIKLPPKIQKMYKRLEDDFFLEFEAGDATAFNAAALSSKLRQFIQGAVYLDDDGSGGPRKFQELHKVKINALKELVESSAGNPILCAIQFKFELEMIRKEFKNVPCISGGTSTSLAQKHIKNWNAGNIPLLLCHPASIGHGVNIQTGGHTMLWFGITWNLEHYQQLIGRLYRQGQKHAVIVHHFVTENTIDERVIQVLKLKDANQAKLLDALKR
jgi:SNF2 family DNA or RNA helicase